MAKKIYGLDIQIGADTTKLRKALSDINKDTKVLEAQLKVVDEKLKLDPKNAQLIAERIKILAQQSQTAANRVDILKSATESLNKQYASGQISSKEYAAAQKDLSIESSRASLGLQKIKTSMSDTKKETKEASVEAQTFMGVFKGNILSTIATKGLSLIAGAVRSIATAFVDAGKKAVSFSANLIKNSIQSAADLQETIGSLTDFFGEADMKRISDWAGTLADKFGMSKAEAEKMISSLTPLLLNKGLTSNETMNWAQQLTERAADIGAAKNMDVSEVMTYIQAVMRGTYSSIDALGISMRASSVEARALQNQLDANGGSIIGLQTATDEYSAALEAATKAKEEYGSESELAIKADEEATKKQAKLDKILSKTSASITDEEKAVAALHIIIEQSDMFSGRATEESGGWNGMIRSLRAETQNLKDDLGAKLLPAAETVLGKLKEFYESPQGQLILDSIATGITTLAGEVTSFVTSNEFGTYASGVLDDVKENIEKITGALDDTSGKISGIKDGFEKVHDAVEPVLNILLAVWNLLAWIPESGLLSILANQFTGLINPFQDENSILNKVLRKFGTDTSKWTKPADKAVGLNRTTTKMILDMSVAVRNSAKTDEQLAAEYQTAVDDYKNKVWGGDNGSAPLLSIPVAKTGNKELDAQLEKFQDSDFVGMQSDISKSVEENSKTIADGSKDIVKTENELKEKSNTATASFAETMQTNLRAAGSGAALVPLRKTLAEAQVLADQIKALSGTEANINFTTTSTKGSQSSSSLKARKKRASGGAVTAGTLYNVNETGLPESFIPAVDGRILSASETKNIMNQTNNKYGGNITLSQNITVSGSDPRAGERVASQFVDACRRKGINPTKI